MRNSTLISSPARQTYWKRQLAVAFEAFAFADPALGPILDDWVKSEPTSYPAHLARAKYRAELGWQARGSRYANETSEQQMNEMASRLSEAAAEAVAAIKLNPKSSIAYALLLDVAKAEGDDKSLDHVYSVGIASVPLSYLIRVSAMEALEPRWGGSYAMMTSLADDAQKSVSKNPRLASLKGSADVDRGKCCLECRRSKRERFAFLTRRWMRAGILRSATPRAGISIGDSSGQPGARGS